MIARALIVGYGSIGKRHLALARSLLPKAEIAILRHQPCSAPPEMADACFASLEEALAFGPQIAVIANPATFHLDAALPLAAAGIHLLVEKPLAAATEGIPPLLQVCRERGTVLMTAYCLRFVPSLQTFRSLVLSEAVGRVLSVRCEVGQYLPGWRPNSDYRACVSARQDLGGGALLELSHELDYLRWIFGEVDWVTASLSRQSDLEIDVEDTAHLVLGFAPSADGRQLIGAASMDFVRRDTTRYCLAIGDKGSLRWNGLARTVERLDAGATTWQEVFRDPAGQDAGYLAEWQHFLECVAKRQKPSIGGEDGLGVLEIVEAARRASASGQRTDVARLGLRNGSRGGS